MHCNVSLGRGHPGLMRQMLLLIMPLVEDRSLDLLTSSPASLHFAMDPLNTNGIITLINKN